MLHMITCAIRYIARPLDGRDYMTLKSIASFRWDRGCCVTRLLPFGRPKEIGISLNRSPASRTQGYRPYSGHSKETGGPHRLYSCWRFENMSIPQDGPRNRRQQSRCAPAQWHSDRALTLAIRTLHHLWTCPLGIIRTHHHLVLTFTLNWTNPLIWRDTSYRRFLSGNSTIKAAVSIQLHILCVIDTQCFTDWEHLLILFASGPILWQPFPPPASRHLTGRYSVVQYYDIYTVTCA